MGLYQKQGIEIHYRDIGTGPILLLLHGFGGSPKEWDQVILVLSQKYRVIVPRLSSLFYARPRMKISQQIEVLKNFIDHLRGIERIYIAGTSFGGLLSWALVAQHQETFVKACYLNPLPTFPGNKFVNRLLRWSTRIQTPQGIYLITLPWAHKLVDEVVQTFGLETEENKRGRLKRNLRGKKLKFLIEVLHRFSWLLRTQDWNEWEDKIKKQKVATLFIYTTQDPLIADPSYREFAQLFPVIQVKKIGSRAHRLIREHSSLVAIEILNFFN